MPLSYHGDLTFQQRILVGANFSIVRLLTELDEANFYGDGGEGVYIFGEKSLV
jgi:hypothetical protein